MIKTKASHSVDVGAEDDASYKRSVRNTAALLLVVVIVLVAGLILPAYFVPAGGLATSTFAYDPNGLTLSISVNTTQAFAPSGVTIKVWINGTSSIENVTAQDSWAVSKALLWGRSCTPGWPIGIGVMHGYYDQYNYTTGTLLPLNQQEPRCPVLSGSPRSFLVEAYGSVAITSINGSLVRWNLQTSLVLTKASFATSQLSSGTFTVIGADEWGGAALLYFVVPLSTS